MSPEDAAADDATGAGESGSRYGEPDPEADLPDPESDLPSVPAAPSPPSPPAESEVPPGLLRAFWTTVAVFNVALLALSVGLLMVAFDVHRTLGLALLAVGVLSLARGYRKYRTLAGRND